ncbi:adenylate/guanylate cyclase domain-containing protein [Vineibacter terrae]|uniref:adenylate/guanylate cyclase domain-containing protein n=1 Tax=Vineibacter terrae TaxID=2586908 RepID=UPI002E34846F|nr:adenylate/guanylate cyclase domain-containing protein [Vineibacter terrae]HEX2891465.1 adenylate/guanylate cyclase domain-containing protein [Vineibacter terrae]
MAGEHRRLAAIISADVVGYSRLMGRDEAGTLTRLREHREQRLKPVLARHSGRLVKLTGDGVLAELPSAVGALAAAIEFQIAVAAVNQAEPDSRAIRFRLGLHMGDLIVEDDDLYGDGVNVAARLQAEAPPGGIVISRGIHEAVVGRLSATFDDLGELNLKNIERPVRAFRVHWNSEEWQASAKGLAAIETLSIHALDEPPALPDKPSVAVLPFTNLSGDVEQEYFTDGITDDIITQLCRFHSLLVIARNSTFTYKRQAIDVRTVGRELGVRYVVVGSIRRVANQIRVNVQLIDALTGSHIWSETYDRVLDDLFAVQEELTQGIVRAIVPNISEIEEAKARRRRPDNLSAYEIATRANAKIFESILSSNRDLLDAAVVEARAALTIDGRSTLALDTLAKAQWTRIQFGTASDPEAAMREGLAAATKSIELDRTSSFSHSLRGMLLCEAPADPTRRHEALANLQWGYDLNPNNTWSLAWLAYVRIVVGEAASAIDILHRALRVSPRDPLRGLLVLLQFARASFALKEYANGVRYAEVGLSETPSHPSLHRQLAMNLVGLRKFDEASAALLEARRIAPEFVERGLQGTLGYDDPEQHRRALTFLRIAAGLEPRAAIDFFE